MRFQEPSGQMPESMMEKWERETLAVALDQEGDARALLHASQTR